jgi:hypothetical protein
MLSRSQLNERGYSQAYIDARMKIENLCCHIGSDFQNNEKTMEIYQAIENEYINQEPERAELFKKIYRSRVERLCEESVRKKC